MFQSKGFLHKLIAFLRHYHFAIAVILIIGILILEGIFLYKYFYQTLTESRVLAELKQRAAAMEILKVPVYEQLTEFYANKQKTPPTNWEALRDPFTSYE